MPSTLDHVSSNCRVVNVCKRRLTTHTLDQEKSHHVEYCCDETVHTCRSSVDSLRLISERSFETVNECVGTLISESRSLLQFDFYVFTYCWIKNVEHRLSPVDSWMLRTDWRPLTRQAWLDKLIPANYWRREHHINDHESTVSCVLNHNCKQVHFDCPLYSPGFKQRYFHSIPLIDRLNKYDKRWSAHEVRLALMDWWRTTWVDGLMKHDLSW